MIRVYVVKNLSTIQRITTGIQLRALISLLILAIIAPLMAYASVNVPSGDRAEAFEYKCEIVGVYSRLNRISTEYGGILINEGEDVIYYASKEAAGAFDGVRRELSTMYVPESMKGPHEMLVKSVSTYIDSARSIEKALGIYLGELEGTEDETLELVNEGERQVVLANQYLSQSLEMHDKILVFDEDITKSCRKYVAGL